MIHLPVFSLIAAMLLWASSFIVLKLSFQYYHPIWVIFGRMVVASLVFALWIPTFRRIRFRRADIPVLAAMALCEPCLYFLLEANALKNTSASQAGLITTFMPLLVTLGAFLRGTHVQKGSCRTVHRGFWGGTAQCRQYLHRNRTASAFGQHARTAGHDLWRRLHSLVETAVFVL